MRGELLLYSLTGVGATVWAEIANAPPEVMWIVASAAGTVCGATASAFAYTNISGAQRAVRVLVSFLVGLLIAPYAAAHIPRPDSVPHALHIFSVSGACAFAAWSLVRVVQRRMGAIADHALDRIAPRKRKDDSDGDGA